jgi:hypothetical protein
MLSGGVAEDMTYECVGLSSWLVAIVALVE